MERRGFLRGILAAGMAPAVVKAGVLMPLGKIWTPPTAGIAIRSQFITPTMYTEECLRVLQKNLFLSIKMTQKHYVELFNEDVIRVQTPIRYAAC